MTALRLVLVAVLAATVARAQSPAPALVDQRGRTVPTRPPATRVVTFNSALWLYLTLDGGAGPIKGASSSTVRVVATGLLGRAFPRAAATIATTVAADGFFLPNVEAIMMLSPDAVFQWAGRNDPAYLDPLERAELPVIGLRQNESDDDYLATARLLGHVAGRDQQAEGLIRRYRDSYRHLDATVAGLGPRHRPRVLYLWKTRPMVPIDGANFYGRLLERSGGVNAAADLRRPGAVGMERILAWDPEVVLLFCCDHSRPADYYADPRWQAVTAVRERRVYKIPTGGSRFGDIVEGPLFSRWLTELLFPDLPATLRDDLRRTYRDVYHLDLSDTEIDATLQMDANAQSAHAERFAAPSRP